MGGRGGGEWIGFPKSQRKPNLTYICRRKGVSSQPWLAQNSQEMLKPEPEPQFKAHRKAHTSTRDAEDWLGEFKFREVNMKGRRTGTYASIAR